MFIYKHLNKEHLTDFKNTGKILLHTLSYYRSEEAKESVRDEFEGRKIHRIDPNKEPVRLSGKQGQNCTFQRIQFSKKITEDAFTVMPNAHYKSEIITDAYVFCASFTREKIFGYNEYYKIVNPLQFAKIIYEELRKNKVPLRDGFGYGKVKYANKEISITNQNKNEILSNNSNDFFDICFTKPLIFDHQKEFRMVFIPAPDVKYIEPRRFITSLELLKCCEF